MAILALVACGLLAAPAIRAATVAADSEVLAATPALKQSLPLSREFVVSTAGDLEVQLSDVASPAAFSNLQLVVARGATRVARLDAPGSVRFTAQPGNYRVHVVGTAAAPAGTFNVAVRTVTSGTVLLQFADGMVASPAAANPARSVLDTSFSIPQAGTYRVTLTDRAMPAALASVDLLLLRQGGGAAPVTMSAAGVSAPFSVASAGTYDLVVTATAAAPDQAGLYSVAVAGGPTGATTFASTEAVGQLPAPTAVVLPGSGTYTLVVSDFAVPASLSLLRAAVAQGASLLALPAGEGTTTLPVAAGGEAKLFVFAKAGASGAGSYGVRIAQAAQAIFADARTVPAGLAGGFAGYRYSANVPAPAGYQVSLRDHAFPTAFTTLRAVVSQGGTLLQSVLGSQSATASLASGPVVVLVIAQPTSTASSSLFGVSLAPQAGGTALLESTQGVGGLFQTRSITLSSAGSYDLSVSDLGFPATFSEIAAALTQGTRLSGQLFNSGSRFTFSANPGTYTLNILARLPNGQNYGSWGYLMETTPAVPTVTLASNPASVTTQQTATLQWSSTDATSCTASGSWSGSRAASGTETVGPFSANASFTLQCAGPGGTASKSVALAVTQPAAASGSSGGGGTTDVLTLLGLLCLAWARLRAPRNFNSILMLSV